MGVAASVEFAEKLGKTCEGFDASDSLPIENVCCRFSCPLSITTCPPLIVP